LLKYITSDIQHDKITRAVNYYRRIK